MNVCVLSGSPKGDHSLTLQSALALQKMYPNDSFEICKIGNGEVSNETKECINNCDLLMILTSLFHFNVHQQTIVAFREIEKSIDLTGKYATYLTTSGFNMDIPAHNFVKDFMVNAGANYIRSLSLLDEDILKPEGREELYRWFTYIKDYMCNCSHNTHPNFSEKRRVVIIDAGDTKNETENAISVLKSSFSELNCDLSVYSLRDFNLKPCIACFGCYTDCKCKLNDDYEKLANYVYKNTDAIFVVGIIKYGQFGPYYKTWLDRHVQFGRHSSETEIVKCYIYCNKADDECVCLEHFEHYCLVVDSLNRDFYTGTYNESHLTCAIDDVVRIVNNEMYPQRNTYSLGLNLQFAKLGYHLQNMTPVDYEFYKSHGYYNKLQINTHAGSITDMTNGIEMCKNRLIPFKIMLSELSGAPELTKRRPNKDKTLYDRNLEISSQSNSGKSKGLFSFFNKNKE
jgi:multimeric flavodoxin WrbA